MWQIVKVVKSSWIERSRDLAKLGENIAANAREDIGSVTGKSVIIG